MYNPELVATMNDELKTAIEAIRAGRMVLMVDSEDRENEGDLVSAAELITPEVVNFMITHARGILCMPMDQDRLEQLQLPLMCKLNTSAHNTAFTVSIEASSGVTTGVSAYDRARTIQVASAIDAKPEDIVRPGHVYPLLAKANGVLERDGHTEGSIDLVKMAGLRPVAVICEVLNEDGTMARLPQLKVFAQKYDIPIVSVQSIINWRREHDPMHEAARSVKNRIKAGEVAKFPNVYGGEDFKIQAFMDVYGNEHVAVIKGDVANPPDGVVPLVRMHSECLTGDVLGSLRCDCGPQLHHAMKVIGQAPCGVLIYLRGHEGRGIGLFNKISAYVLQDKGLDTVEANHQLGFATDMRDWEGAWAILDYLGIRKLDLLTNNLDKVAILEEQGFKVENRVPLETDPNPYNYAYLQTKRERMGHDLHKKLKENMDKGKVV
ncbi:MAG: 3,4-dihydroxy-2-butanone-4-phosphate synthase [Commensalibacter sp.]